MRTKPEERPVAAAPTVPRSSDEDAGAASGQVEGEAGALDPGAHDDDVGRCAASAHSGLTPGGMQTVAGCRRYRTVMAEPSLERRRDASPRAGATGSRA